MTTAMNRTDSEADSSAANQGAVQPDGDPAATTAMLRRQIDAMDAAIVNLVAERARLSRRIQTVRMNAGGTKVELGRERVILETYRDALGAQGPHLADAVLQVCRGLR